MSSSSLTWELLKSSSESMAGEALVRGVAGRGVGVAESGVCFFAAGSRAGPDGSTKADALRLREGEVVVMCCEPDPAVMTRPGYDWREDEGDEWWGGGQGWQARWQGTTQKHADGGGRQLQEAATGRDGEGVEPVERLGQRGQWMESQAQVKCRSSAACWRSGGRRGMHAQRLRGGVAARAQGRATLGPAVSLSGQSQPCRRSGNITTRRGGGAAAVAGAAFTIAMVMTITTVVRSCSD
ncbi:hypothetical protein BCR34DRAFT_26149 [Clohesyomyces aquaticus]|uniref:Uncharacterized protein n=1 Tax=Clohesyomyces aquaticus TaxID=1231657 RepID=A0A1Y1ZBX5_9PLEO|nr:hypothetical protein BCR34DRAFT_26149 [Clohesyomyces aquaticus]